MLATLLAGTLISAEGLAQQSVWTSAAQPQGHARAQVIAQAEQSLSDHYFLRRRASVSQSARALNKARRILERANIKRSANPRERYLLATTYYGLYDTEREARHLARARDHYRYVVDHPKTTRSLRTEALNDLAIVYARLGDHNKEALAYTRALELEPHAETRAVLLANRAEGFMVLGDILRAVRGYRQSLAATPSAVAFRLSVTTRWGLAVALDRSGNLDGAMQRIAEARSYDPTDRGINGPSWFYVPSYDDRWYQALGHWSHARQAKQPEVRATQLRSSIRAWRQYIELAPSSDHWRALAERRLRQCECELSRLMARKPKGKRTPRRRPPRKRP